MRSPARSRTVDWCGDATCADDSSDGDGFATERLRSYMVTPAATFVGYLSGSGSSSSSTSLASQIGTSDPSAWPGHGSSIASSFAQPWPNPSATTPAVPAGFLSGSGSGSDGSSDGCSDGSSDSSLDGYSRVRASSGGSSSSSTSFASQIGITSSLDGSRVSAGDGASDRFVQAAHAGRGPSSDPPSSPARIDGRSCAESTLELLGSDWGSSQDGRRSPPVSASDGGESPALPGWEPERYAASPSASLLGAREQQ